jgi:hypothetical protein
LNSCDQLVLRSMFASSKYSWMIRAVLILAVERREVTVAGERGQRAERKRMVDHQCRCIEAALLATIDHVVEHRRVERIDIRCRIRRIWHGAGLRHARNADRRACRLVELFVFGIDANLRVARRVPAELRAHAEIVDRVVVSPVAAS